MLKFENVNIICRSKKLSENMLFKILAELNFVFEKSFRQSYSVFPGGNSNFKAHPVKLQHASFIV
jgi:hypothetical protein